MAPFDPSLPDICVSSLRHSTHPATKPARTRAPPLPPQCVTHNCFARTRWPFLRDAAMFFVCSYHQMPTDASAARIGQNGANPGLGNGDCSPLRSSGTRGEAAAKIGQLKGESKMNSCRLLLRGNSFFRVADVVCVPSWHRSGDFLIADRLAVANVVATGATLAALCVPAEPANNWTRGALFGRW